MAVPVTFHYQVPPSLGALYTRGLLGARRKVKRTVELPNWEAIWTGARVDQKRLASYRTLCGCKDDGCLPAMYPYVMSQALHVAFATHKDFPVKPMGLVHQRIHVLQHRPIDINATMEVRCAILGSRVLNAGLEFDVSTVVNVRGVRHWECLSSYLSRGRYGEPGEPAAISEIPRLDEGAPMAEWDVPSSMGKRYARASGDYNPIHISKLLARMFGFKRDIIHGMWAAAACLSRLPEFNGATLARYDIIFKGPVFMGSHVSMKGEHTADGQLFNLFCGDNARPVIRGYARTEGNLQPILP